MSSLRIRPVFLVLLFGLHCLQSGSPTWAADAGAVNAAMESITAADAQQFVNELADDSLEGRYTGSRGGRAAGIYLGKKFQALGLRGGAADGGYYQPFDSGSRNILGWIEGSDPELKKQYVLVSAHYDHIGYGSAENSFGPTGQIHNGADDNASGVSGILEVASAFTKLPQPPKRSVMFALWDAEEEGLFGSKYWIKHPTVPLIDVAAVLNVDMIGRLRNDRVIVYGGRTSYGWRQLISRENEPTHLLLNFDWEMKSDSDHHPFYIADVPVVMLHTGLHEDYHRPSDDAEKINSDGLRLVSQLLFRAALDVADADIRPKFRATSHNETSGTRSTFERPLPPLAGRLGLSWDPALANDGTIQLRSVTQGAPAAKAGLRAGDRIVSYAGTSLSGPDELRRLVLATRGAVPLSVERKGAAQPIELTITPSGDPVRLGMSWQVDDAEPGAVTVLRIVTGSPADQAGLAVLDRIYEVNGQRFTTGDEFRSLANSLPAPLELLVETRGRLRHVEVQRLDFVTAPQSSAAPPSL